MKLIPQIPLAEKKVKMAEWWQRHFKLLIESGLNKKDIKKIIKDPRIQLRKGAKKFLKSLADNNIPLVILSSAGLGRESVQMILEKNNYLFDNIHIISNEFEYDKEGKAVKVKEPIIHALNKDETIIKQYPEIYKKIKDRGNVILLGDNVGDNGMVEGFEYDNLMRISFLNDNVKENLEAHKRNFDVVITNDGDMDFVNNLLKEII